MLYVTMIDGDGKDLGKTWVSACPPLGAEFPTNGKNYVVAKQRFPEPAEGEHVRNAAIFTLLDPDEYHGFDMDDH